VTSGSVEEVKAAFLAYGDSIHGNSRFEFEDAKSHIVGLIDQNFDHRLDAPDVGITLEAFGSGLCETPPPGVMGGKPTAVERNLTVRISKLFGYRSTKTKETPA